MGKARIGGTKSKLRGKVGGDIYQLKRDPNGTLIQSVYAQNQNPTYSNTEKQAKNRMIMGQIQRMWHWLPQIIKDSFASVPRGTLSFQKFSQLNYSLLRSDFENHYEENPDFDWQLKYEMTAPAGPWLLTHGTLPEVTWDSAVSSLGWNNGIELEWNSRASYETYGDFLDCFGLKHGDRLVVVFFRKNGLQLWGYVETWSFYPRKDYAADLSWRYVDDEHVFETNCPYTVLAAQLRSPQGFSFDIDCQDYPDEMKIACFAFFVVRPSDNGTLFSSSQFTWAQNNVPSGYRRRTPAVARSSWYNE